MPTFMTQVLSVVAMTDDDGKTAQAHVNELLNSAWQDRKDFVYEVEPSQSLCNRANAAASASGDGPVIVLDHYDNTASGGNGHNRGTQRGIGGRTGKSRCVWLL